MKPPTLYAQKQHAWKPHNQSFAQPSLRFALGSNRSALGKSSFLPLKMTILTPPSDLFLRKNADTTMAYGMQKKQSDIRRNGGDMRENSGKRRIAQDNMRGRYRTLCGKTQKDRRNAQNDRRKNTEGQEKNTERHGGKAQDKGRKLLNKRKDYTEHYEEKLRVFRKFFHFLRLILDFCCIFARTKVEPDVFFRRHSGRNCGIQAEIAAFRQKMRRSGRRLRSFPLRFHIHIILT